MDEEPDIHDLVAAYALGALAGIERRRFEGHLARCTRCRDELPGLRGAAAALALDVEAAQPSLGLRDRIVSAARAEHTASTAAAVPLRMRGSRWPLTAGLAAVAACAAIGLGVWATLLALDLRHERTAHGQDPRALRILADPTGVRYRLYGARGQVVVTRARDAALVVERLVHAPRGKTYELWVVVAQQPRPAGQFEGGGDRTFVALERRVPPGAQVSVSLERRGTDPRVPGLLLFGAQTA